MPGRPTINDVADRAGVSAMTVSRVINASPRVHPDTRKLVEGAIAELGYVPNSLARGLSRKRTGTLGVIVPDVANPFWTLVVRGAEAVARQADHRVMLCNTENDLDLEAAYFEDMVSHRVEGLIVGPVSDASRANLRRLTRHNIPLVLIDREVPGFGGDLVQGDSVGGARRLVDHLVSIGHRRIAHITEAPDVSTARDRLRGYRDSLAVAGLPADPELVVEETPDPDGGYRGMQRLLELGNRPDAVFAVNNRVAIGAVRAIRDAGLEVPGDIGLVCFDDVADVAAIYPFLTVMSQPEETFGTIASQLLLERIEGRASERRRVVVLPAELIVRRSCGMEEED